MHLLPLLTALAGCGGSPPPPPPPEPPPEEAPAPDEPATPAGDPDLTGFVANPGELVGCPPGTLYTETASETGKSAWCDKGGKKHGNYRRVFVDGTDAEKGGYLEGQQDGLWTSWHLGGATRESRGLWNHGKRLGTWVYWANTGQLEQGGDYLNGRRAGVWSEYDENGRVWKEGMYDNDRKHGKWSVFRPGEEAVVDHLEVWERGVLKGDAPAPPPAPVPGAPPAPVP